MIQYQMLNVKVGFIMLNQSTARELSVALLMSRVFKESSPAVNFDLTHSIPIQIMVMQSQSRFT